MPSVSQKLSKIRVEPQFSGTDIKNSNENESSDNLVDSDEDENDDASGDDSKDEMIEDGNKKDEVVSDQKDSDIGEEDENLSDENEDDKKQENKNTVSSGPLVVECDSRKSKNKKNIQKLNIENVNSKKRQKLKSILNEKFIDGRSDKSSGKLSDSSKCDKYTPSRKRQFKSTTSGSFVVEDISSEKKTKVKAEHAGLYM